MDSIMQWTDGLTTAVATLSFALSFLLGIWCAARFGMRTVWWALIAAGAAFFVRLELSALSSISIICMSIVHLSAGCGIGLWLRRSKNFGPPAN
ncbi:MAG TPA: hypothetical protein V6D22_07800 [Candidatus Obscuribacterales bacterium]